MALSLSQEGSAGFSEDGPLEEMEEEDVEEEPIEDRD
jgi:hypothetical protein